MSGSGGLLSLTAVGSSNKILLGNPSISSFKAKYHKTKNFGKQVFRLDYDGQRDLRLTESSTFQFSIKRHADLLLDTFICINLPDIWSPIYHPCPETNNQYSSYDFRWIDDIGFQMIEEIMITSGSLVLSKFSGAYISNAIDRDYPSEKKDLINRATGNIDELNDPSVAFGRGHCYPSAFYTSHTGGAEPSIRGRQLIIPIHAWYTLEHKCAFPLISLPYNELVITIRLKPIQELFRVRDVFDMANNNPYIQPDFNQQQFALYRFLQTPPNRDLSPSKYEYQLSNWNADVHLLCDYVFLDEEERADFANSTQLYLVRDVYEYLFENKVGTSKSQLYTNALVTNWMFYFQRNDVQLRNEWTNYTNWPYSGIPSDIQLIDLVNPDGSNTGYFMTGDFNNANLREILLTMGIVIDGNYRENSLTSGFYDYIEKIHRTSGGGKNGLYFYNFGLETGKYQPTGAMNMSKFRTIELEYTTLTPQIDSTNSNQNVICDLSGNPIGVYKSNYRLYSYSFNLFVQEERYNIVSFQNGCCGLLYSR